MHAARTPRRRSAAAARAHRSVTPPTTRGTSSWSQCPLPGSMRSGEKATNTSRPGRRPRSASGWRAAPAWSRRTWCSSARSSGRGARARRRSRRRRAGTAGRARAIVDRRRHADHDRVRRLQRAGARRERELVELDRRLQALPLPAARSTLPSRMSCSRRSLTSTPITFAPPCRQTDPRREPDVAESQHRNGTSRISCAGIPVRDLRLRC